MQRYIYAVKCFVGLLLLVGCIPANEHLAENNVITTLTLSAASTKVEEMLPSSTPTPKMKYSSLPTQMPFTATPNIQVTITPNLPTATPTPTQFPTFDIAYSDLSKEDATQKLIELLKTNRGCELPCWWGIIPGETDVDSLEHIFVPLGFNWNRDFESLRDNASYKASTSLTSEDNIVHSIKVRGGAREETYDRNEAWRPYAIPQVLERLGLPENVYVYYPFRFDPGGMQAYRMFLYYPDLGVEIDYLGKATLIDNRPGWAQACHNILETDEINLFLFQPGTVPDYLEQTMPESSLPLPKLEGDPYDWVSWEQATESSLDEFWRLFTETDEEAACFKFKTYWTDN